jgi:hypothetical protein
MSNDLTTQRQDNGEQTTVPVASPINGESAGEGISDINTLASNVTNEINGVAAILSDIGLAKSDGLRQISELIATGLGNIGDKLDEIEARKNAALSALDRRKDTLLVVLKASANPGAPPSLEPCRDEQGLMNGNC